MPDRTTLLSPLAHAQFRKLWTASIASNLGTLIQTVGAGWLMTSITSSENMVALVQASAAMPIMLFSIVAGAIADNFDRRRVILVAQVFLCAISFLLTGSAGFGFVTPWTLLTLTFLIGCGTALAYPAWQASIGDLIPRDDVANAVSLSAIAVNITRSVGPAIGGVVVAVGGAAAAFAANTIFCVGLVATFLRWERRQDIGNLPREDIGQAILAGLSYVSMSPHLLKVYLRSFVFGAAAIAVLALLPVVTHQKIGGGPLAYGLMLAAFGVGAVLAALLNAHLRSRLSSEALIRISFGCFVASELAVAASSQVAVLAVAIVIAGASWVIALSLFNTTVQLSAPRWVAGRALAFYQTASFGGMTGGSWLWGTIAESKSLDAAFFFAALLAIAGLLIGILLPMPMLETADLDPLQHFKEPMLRLNIRPRSGPIAVHIDYEIREEDTEEFLELMEWRRRVRIRDGAKSWRLLRDLENPSIWMETYHTPTWADYIRHNQRRTNADGDNHHRLLALHRGERPIGARRFIERQVIPPADDVFHQAAGEIR